MLQFVAPTWRGGNMTELIFVSITELVAVCVCVCVPVCVRVLGTLYDVA